ncbi:hypothetical protein DH2020_032419 [Rehmannia glutinosa]|uniref:DOG1 domain-containing protein n=1 Tax=Rehmannia glutinosa TaxID=99300 RepID=A0ABR0VI62_REHGL
MVFGESRRSIDKDSRSSMSDEDWEDLTLNGIISRLEAIGVKIEDEDKALRHLVSSHSNEHMKPILIGDGSGRNATNGTNIGELQQSAGNGFNHLDIVDLTRSTMYNSMKASSGSVVSSNLQFGGLTNSLGSADQMGSSNRGVGLMLQRGGNVILGFGGSLGNGQFENWTDNSGVVADHSQQTDNTSTDTDAKNQALCRLAQNREAARKSRMRKKAYVQQLENSRQRLVQLEQDLKRARQQGVYVAPGFSGDQSHSMGGSVDSEITTLAGRTPRLVNDLRSAVNSHVGDGELQLVVDKVMSHYEEIFGLKAQVLGNQIEPLTEQQLVGICNLQQSSQQTEDALSQGMEALQQSLVDTLSSNSLGPRNSGNIADYMGQMAIAMSKLATLENFVHRARPTCDIGACLAELIAL